MTPLERLRKLHEEAFVKGQAMVSRTKAAEDFTEHQAVTREAAKAALETIELANELAADNDPHKKRLATLIKDYAVGGVEEVATTSQLPAEEGRMAIEANANPFSVASSGSETSLPESTKALPHTPPPQQQPVKRGRGRPRKQPQG